MVFYTPCCNRSVQYRKPQMGTEGTTILIYLRSLGRAVRQIADTAVLEYLSLSRSFLLSLLASAASVSSMGERGSVMMELQLVLAVAVAGRLLGRARRGGKRWGRCTAEHGYRERPCAYVCVCMEDGSGEIRARTCVSVWRREPSPRMPRPPCTSVCALHLVIGNLPCHYIYIYIYYVYRYTTWATKRMTYGVINAINWTHPCKLFC